MRRRFESCRGRRSDRGRSQVARIGPGGRNADRFVVRVVVLGPQTLREYPCLHEHLRRRRGDLCRPWWLRAYDRVLHPAEVPTMTTGTSCAGQRSTPGAACHWDRTGSFTRLSCRRHVPPPRPPGEDKARETGSLFPLTPSVSPRSSEGGPLPQTSAGSVSGTAPDGRTSRSSLSPDSPGSFFPTPSPRTPVRVPGCISTEIDLAWTYVGGPGALIERILTDEQIEAEPARPRDTLTRVED